MADVERLFAHWAKFPPLRDLVAAAIGFETPKAEAAAPRHMTAEEFKAMFAATGGRVPGMGPGM